MIPRHANVPIMLPTAIADHPELTRKMTTTNRKLKRGAPKRASLRDRIDDLQEQLAHNTKHIQSLEQALGECMDQADVTQRSLEEVHGGLAAKHLIPEQVVACH